MTLDNPIDCPYYLISRLTLSVTAALKNGFTVAGVEGIKPAYLGALLALWQEDGVKTVDLGRRAGLEPSTMTGLLDRMESDGIIHRTPDPSDRRAQRIHLSRRGRDIREPVMKVVDRVLNDMSQGVDEGELSRAMEVLKQLYANAQRRLK